MKRELETDRPTSPGTFASGQSGTAQANQAPAQMDAGPVQASYFDGKTSRRHTVRLHVQGATAILSGDIERSIPIALLHVSERMRNAPRKVTFPDGAYLEIQDPAAFNVLLGQTGHRDSWLVRVQQSWRASLLAFGVTIGMLVLAYVYALPLASKVIVAMLPERIERSLSREALAYLDQAMFSPSALPAEKRQAISSQFAGLRPPRENAPQYEILFRKSRIGPNAFALPSGQIVLTDEIVRLVDSDDAVMGILAHELGHLHEHHMMRRIIQSGTIAAAVTVLMGDASAVIANIPTFLLDMKYSRDTEREADDYAVAMFKANGLPMSELNRVFEKLGEGKTDRNTYLSSHPSGKERIERIKRQDTSH